MARIFIADDDPDIRHLLTYALADEGHQVAAAGDGPSALEALRSDSCDVLILDIMMPDMDGYELLNALEEADIRQTMKVMILTAKGSERDWEQGFEAGADLYITKPFDPQEVTEGIDRLLTSTDEELSVMRERERDRAHLLSQLEDILGDV
jgi:DNA-binding response OmpR family regulator